MSVRFFEYFDALAKEQFEAAVQSEGDQLVEAAPGSGKTRTLVAKALCEAEQRPVYVMTFTTGAAEEIAGRIKVLAESQDIQENKHWEGIRHVGTLHSWALGFVRSCGCKMELIDEDGMMTVGKDVNDRLRLRLSDKRIKELMGVEHATNFGERQFINAWAKDMHEHGLLSYDGLLRLALQYMALAPPRWRYRPVLCVDEIQDSSVDDIAIYEAFKQAGADLWLVGDLQQAIYSFRHPRPANVWQWWGDRKVAQLSINFRSSQAVVKALNLINATFNPRLEIQPAENARVGEVKLLSARTEAEQLEQLVGRITQLLGLRWRQPGDQAEIAVLCRTNRECELVSAILQGRSLSVRQKKQELPEAVPAILWAALGMFRQPQSDWMARRYLKAIGADAQVAQRNAVKSMKSISQTLYPALYAFERTPFDWFSNNWMDMLQVPKTQQGWFLERMPEGWTDLSWDDIVLRLFEAPKETETGSGITVTTIHSAKGREWRHVLMPFCDQHSFRPKNGPEEERVFFVGASRAAETLTFLQSETRIDEWKGGELDVAICQPLERVIEGAKTFKASKRTKRKK